MDQPAPRLWRTAGFSWLGLVVLAIAAPTLIFITTLVGPVAVDELRYQGKVRAFGNGSLLGLPRSDIEARYDDGKWDPARMNDSYYLGADFGWTFAEVTYDANDRLVSAKVIYD